MTFVSALDCTDNNNNTNSDTIAYAYERQPPPPPLPVPLNQSTYPMVSESLLSQTAQHTSAPHVVNDNDFLLYLNSNLFLSPQFPYQDQQQSLVDTPLLSYSPPPPPSDPQQLVSPFVSWNNPLLDMLQAAADIDNILYPDTSSMDMDRVDDSSLLNNNMLNNTDVMDTHNSASCQINLQVSSFTDLKNALESFYGQTNPLLLLDNGTPPPPQQHTSGHGGRFGTLSSTKQQEVQQQQQQQTIPVRVRDTVESTSFLASLMAKAQTHWCCIGFKVAPITLDVIQNWQQAPITIVYCVASIALVTFMDHNAGQAYVKTAAMEFYEQARRKMDDIVFDDENDKSNYSFGDDHGDDDDDDSSFSDEISRQKAMTIQSYFCLSYTSNLLRLYEQQRTWGGLASIALQLRTKDMETGCRPVDDAIVLCFCRWYYVDAWMALTLQRECLLPETPPQFIQDAVQSSSLWSSATTAHNSQLLQDHYQFVMLARFIRRYIKIMQSGKLTDPVTMRPSPSYYHITDELKQWHTRIQEQQQRQQPEAESTNSFGTPGNIHFHICYNAMRLVVIYKLLQPDSLLLQPDDMTLMDGLETNFALLVALHDLASRGCDQSTYHHMFFAIHNTAIRIYNTNLRNSKWQGPAKEQLQMNLVLLKGTQAYVNDVFQMRVYAEKIEQQFAHMGLELIQCYETTLSLMATPPPPSPPPPLKPKSQTLPGMHVYKLHTAASIKKPRKSTGKPRKRKEIRIV